MLEIPAEIQSLPEELRQIWEQLPPLVTREVFSQKTSGIYTPRHLAHLDSQGRGPRRRVMAGSKVAYNRTDAVVWLATRIRPL